MQTSELRLTSREANPAPAITESGQVPICRPGDRGRIWTNANGRQFGYWAPCVVLAVLDAVALVEYIHRDPLEPDTYTALARIDATRRSPEPGPSNAEVRYAREHPKGRQVLGPGNRYIRLINERCTYRKLTKAWLRAIVAQYGSWIGMSRAGRVPQPAQVLAERFGDPGRS